MAKVIVGSVVEEIAPDMAIELRRSARREPWGVVRDMKRSAATLADEAAEDPSLIVSFLEALYDAQRQRADSQGRYSR